MIKLGAPRADANTPAYRAKRRAFVCRKARRRYKLRAAGLLPPTSKRQRHMPRVLTISGETRIEKAYREADERVRRAFRPLPTAAALETSSHNMYLRYLRAVHAEFHRRLAAAGVEVES